MRKQIELKYEISHLMWEQIELNMRFLFWYESKFPLNMALLPQYTGLGPSKPPDLPKPPDITTQSFKEVLLNKKPELNNDNVMQLEVDIEEEGMESTQEGKNPLF